MKINLNPLKALLKPDPSVAISPKVDVGVCTSKLWENICLSAGEFQNIKELLKSQMFVPNEKIHPIRFTSSSGTVIITSPDELMDEVGDDTYVPDFQAGNLKFTNVWVEDTAQAGMSTTIHFDIETDTPRYNTYIKVDLMNLGTGGNASDLDLSNGIFEPDYACTSLMIDKLGRVVSDSVVTKTEERTVTTITYDSEDKNKAHVEQTFIVSPQIQDGTYAAVFSINTNDFSKADDALQGEETDISDNYKAAPASIIIGTPDLPNLRILLTELDTNSFELP